ncbi:Ribosomal large subunit pseudouridine synthase E [Caenispirillum salinarum AK4]|uniref:Pseudouridine synthase n=1 Tax=Caenispirillum salinarum AK4 TaxID=1238182 RepID=K9H4Q9_9PROT|nr:pseudouridine synthase [Caenispirillum salinarum]EKV32064.1 Ribosomal large subunit pseudouridine synthase E [Caenispirillum salinarum AK4]
MPSIQRHRAAAGQGRGQRDTLRRAKADKPGKAQAAAPDAAAPKAKAAPSPRKAEPARPTAPTDRPKAVKPEALGKAPRKPRVVRAAPELEREDKAPGRKAGAKGRRPARHGLSGPPRPAEPPKEAGKPPAVSETPRRKPTEAPRYIAFHKPYGVLSQFTAESGHRALAEFDLPPGVYAAGRLDMDSEGLLLLSNDGTFINRLLSPRHGHERSYLVQVEGEPDAAALQALREGVRVRDYVTRPARVETLDAAPDLPPRDPPIRERRHIPTTWLKITLTEGRNRQVRRMTAAVGHPTLRLVRVSIGSLDLGDLPRGRWREVKRKDVLPRG